MGSYVLIGNKSTRMTRRCRYWRTVMSARRPDVSGSTCAISARLASTNRRRSGAPIHLIAVASIRSRISLTSPACCRSTRSLAKPSCIAIVSSRKLPVWAHARPARRSSQRGDGAGIAPDRRPLQAQSRFAARRWTSADACASTSRTASRQHEALSRSDARHILGEIRYNQSDSVHAEPGAGVRLRLQ